MEMTSALTYASPNQSLIRSAAAKPARRLMALLSNCRFMDVAVHRLDVPQ